MQQNRRGPAPAVKPPQIRALPPRRASWLVLQHTETLTDRQAALFKQLQQQPELAGAIALAQGFIRLVRQRLPQQLDDWLANARQSTFQALRSFGKGIRDDYDAVKAELTLEVSNGPVEGQNNRLKMLKRQMFGRAGIELLEKRLILTSA
ncbi:transposase [filamentous cyanobacterium LEGE 11480]|uniref:Transposase n=1 Tax=Romeriopsis navalis LEGE 11480 TaxID=2777977 RepID=A0A928Z4F3_9CYAN|nr:transposase [Romeriopsis navalis]MBE9032551.1 transposase [Romeriopsis navalis LEGE 11480]